MNTAIDLFAGLGGFTETATAAGLRVSWAANHWRPAVEVHAANHPDTLHVCQDLHQANSKVNRPGRASATLERIRHGRKHFGDRFLISYYGNTKTARSIDRPIGTITTRDRWAVIDGDRMRILSVDENRRAMGFREDYILPQNGKLAVHMLGNAVPPPLAQYVISESRRAA